MSLPDLPERRSSPASVSLPDGRTVVIGGVIAGQHAAASVLALAADGSGWSALAPMAQARAGASAVLLPDGKVLVAGGQTTPEDDSALKSQLTVSIQSIRQLCKRANLNIED